MYKKIILLLGIIILIGGCSLGKDKNNFKELYSIETNKVSTISYEDLIKLSEEGNGIVFIGDSSKKSKELAKIFVDNLCKCDVDKSYFINKKNITDDKLLKILDVEKLQTPILVNFEDSKLIGYYDSNVKTENLSEYIDNTIHGKNPNICEEAC